MLRVKFNWVHRNTRHPLFAVYTANLVVVKLRLERVEKNNERCFIEDKINKNYFLLITGGKAEHSDISKE